MQNTSDEELMEMLKAGNKARGEAFATLVRRHTRYFYNVAYRIVLEKETSEDIVQKAFLKIWEKPDLWSGDKAKFKTWFYRIVCNLAIDDRRRLRPVELDFDVVDEREEKDSGEQKELYTALKSIPARQRAAIMLVYFEEKKQIDAAKILGVGVKALESLLSRGKKQLQQSLKQAMK